MVDHEKLFRAASACMVVVSRDLTIVEASDDYVASTYSRREDLLGQNLLRAFPGRPDNVESTNPDAIRKGIEAAFERGESPEPDVVRYDVRSLGGEFEERYWKVWNAPVPDASGAIVFVIHHIEDVTATRRLEEREEFERRRAAAAIERFAIVARASRDAIWDWDIESDTIWWNEGMTELFGYEHNSVPMDAAWSVGQIHPQDRQRVENVIDDAIKRRLHRWRAEYRYRCADGRYIIVENRAHVIRNTNGIAVGMVGSIVDVTDQRRRTATLALLRDLTQATSDVREPLEIMSIAEGLLGTFFNAVRVAYGEIDSRTRTIRVLRDWAKDVPSLVGEYAIADFGPGLAQALWADRAYVVEDASTEQEQEHEAFVSPRGIEASLAVPLLKSGVPVAVILIDQDAPNRWTSHDEDLLRQVVERLYSEIERARLESGLRKMNEELEKRVELRTADLVAKNLELEGFTYSVSHDMRAPLRGMVSNARLLLEDEGPSVSPEGRERLNRLVNAALHMALLVDDLLQYARLGNSEIVRGSIDFSHLVQETAVEVQMERGNCELEIDVQPGLVASGDARLIGMALHNLIDNACKYTKTGESTKVVFGSTQVEGREVFFLRDFGIGFDMAYVGKLFIPFERLHGSEYPGTGIGLANVRRIIERHGGSVWAEGTPDEGATFFFTLDSTE